MCVYIYIYIYYVFICIYDGFVNSGLILDVEVLDILGLPSFPACVGRDSEMCS